MNENFIFEQMAMKNAHEKELLKKKHFRRAKICEFLEKARVGLGMIFINCGSAKYIMPKWDDNSKHHKGKRDR